MNSDGPNFFNSNLVQRRSPEDILYSIYLKASIGFCIHVLLQGNVITRYGTITRYLPGSIISVASLGVKKLFLLL